MERGITTFICCVNISPVIYQRDCHLVCVILSSDVQGRITFMILGINSGTIFY